jgi:DNA replication initiation complex subunit (GINS family)
MAEKEINITYETLFELLRREKNREELQKLENSFFSDVAAYIKGKEETLEQLKSKQDLFASEEKAKAEKQIENLRKILKEQYERREKKMIEMAIDASKTASAIIDTSAMLAEEKLFYENILGLLNRFRQDVLLNLQYARIPQIKKIDETKPAEPKIEEKEPEEDPNIRAIRFIHAVPMFVGPDFEEYGPFVEGDNAKLPVEIANILINKGRAE